MTTKMRTSLDWHEMALPDRFSGVIGPPMNGIREAVRPDGKTVAQAYAWYSDATGEHELVSPVYELVPEADAGYLTPDLYNTNIPVSVWALSAEAAEARATIRTNARARMTDAQRSVLDMVQICRQKIDEAHALQQAWMREQERLAEERRLDAEAVDLYRKWERGKRLIDAEKETGHGH